jgi:hypothetical protein
MAENPTLRQIVKGLLQGISPPRPLILPIVFSLGARVENIPLRAFLGNPTKISNSLRQIRSHLRSDGVACYFDPWLEAEALGGAVQWGAGDQVQGLRWPQGARKGELPEGLRSAEEAAKSGRVGVGVEVIRRLKLLLREDSLLMAGVTGPFTLAVRLAQLDRNQLVRSEHLPDAALGPAAEVMTRIASTFAEAGADIIFILEEVLPVFSAASCESWAASLKPAFNVIRFYGALPVLQLLDSSSFRENSDSIFRQRWDCVVCPTLEGIRSASTRRFTELNATGLGIALPLDLLQPDRADAPRSDEFFSREIAELQPAILTTAGDVPATTDVKRLMRLMEEVRR